MPSRYEHRISPRRGRSAFTLTELLVAVVVLLVVILAVGRIFSTTSLVVRTGEASSRVLQEITAIEQLVRKDFSRISSDGFLLVQCVAVRNDVMQSLGGGDLLDPTQPADHIIRCDQVSFIADDLAIGSRTQGMAAFTEGSGPTGSLFGGDAPPTPQTTTSLVYLGHGYQLPLLPRSLDEPLDPVWPSAGGPALQPWFRPTPGQQRIQLQRWPNGTAYPGEYNGAQPSAKEWALARQEILIADDYDGEPEFYMARSFADQNRNAAAEYFDDAMRSSRVEVLSSDLARLREIIRSEGPQGVSDYVLNYRPRAEKSPPTLEREDVLMASNVLGSNCASFVVDWTWGEGVGQDLSLDLDPNRELQGAVRGVSVSGGVRAGIGGETSDIITEAGVGAAPWFGLGNIQAGDAEPILDNYGNPNLDVTTATTILLDDQLDFYDRGVRLYPPIDYDPGCGIFDGETPPGGTVQDDGSILLPDGTTLPSGTSLFPRVVENIEGADIAGGDLESVVDRPFGDDVPIWRYRAFFGLNGDEPFARDGTRRPVSIVTDGADGLGPRPWPVYRSDYTPWPSALRITATFGDPKGAIEGGRQVQFVIQLPQRVQDLPEG